MYVTIPRSHVLLMESLFCQTQ